MGDKPSPEPMVVLLTDAYDLCTTGPQWVNLMVMAYNYTYSLGRLLLLPHVQGLKYPIASWSGASMIASGASGF